MDPVAFNEDWTADVVGRMHKYRITNVQLAEACDYTPAYLSTVLNGKKTFESEETKAKTTDRMGQLGKTDCRKSLLWNGRISFRKLVPIL